MKEQYILKKCNTSHKENEETCKLVSNANEYHLETSTMMHSKPNKPIINFLNRNTIESHFTSSTNGSTEEIENFSNENSSESKDDVEMLEYAWATWSDLS